MAVSTPDWSQQVIPLNDAEDLREAMRGADIETVQLSSGKLQGLLTHLGIGSLGMTVGQFNAGIRHKGPAIQDTEKVAIALLDCDNSSHWWEQVTSGAIGVFPANVETDAIYRRGAQYIVISTPIRELTDHVGREPLLADPAFWAGKRLFHNDPYASQRLRQGLYGIVSGLELKKTMPSPQAIDFARRAILECFVSTIATTLSQEKERPFRTAARLVSQAEDYVDAARSRPVHISELCSGLNVSRRSLHRAFAEAVDMGPVTYLRRRRLARVHAILSQSASTDIAIADLAFEHGFPEPARFSAYYRSVIGETPSETRRIALTQQKGRLTDPST